MALKKQMSCNSLLKNYNNSDLNRLAGLQLDGRRTA